MKAVKSPKPRSRWTKKEDKVALCPNDSLSTKDENTDPMENLQKGRNFQKKHRNSSILNRLKFFSQTSTEDKESFVETYPSERINDRVNDTEQVVKSGNVTAPSRPVSVVSECDDVMTVDDACRISPPSDRIALSFQPKPSDIRKVRNSQVKKKQKKDSEKQSLISSVSAKLYITDDYESDIDFKEENADIHFDSQRERSEIHNSFVINETDILDSNLNESIDSSLIMHESGTDIIYRTLYSVEEENENTANISSEIYDSQETTDEYADEDADDSNDSDSTPVHCAPPIHATQEERLNYYWNLCYGKNTDTLTHSTVLIPSIHEQGSTNRSAPRKSCLSAKKTEWTSIADSASKRPWRQQMKPNHSFNSSIDDIPTRPPLFPPSLSIGTNTTFPRDNSLLPSSSLFTPSSSIRVFTPMQNSFDGRSTASKSVKFGLSSAAEFDENRPTVELTPLPTEVAQEYYPMDDQSIQSDDSSEEKHKETAYNHSILAEWDDDFDSFLHDEADDDDVEVSSSPMLKIEYDDDATLNSRKRSLSGRRSRMSTDHRDLRRTSVLFSRDGGHSLYDSNDDDDQIIPSSHLSEVSVSPDGIGQQNCIHQQHPSPIMNSSISPIPRNPEPMFRLRPSVSSSDTPTIDHARVSTVLRSVHSDGGAAVDVSLLDDELKQTIKPHQLEFALKSAEVSKSFCKMCIKSEIAQAGDDFLGWNLFSLLYNLAKENHEALQRYYNIDCSYEVLRIFKKESSDMMYLDFVSLIDNFLYHDAESKALMAELFEEITLILEQQVDSNSRVATTASLKNIIEVFHRTNSEDVLIDTYCLLGRFALRDWRKIELQALWYTPSLFQPIIEENESESLHLSAKLGNFQFSPVGAKKSRRERFNDLQQKLRMEIEQYHSLQQEFVSENESLEYAEIELEKCFLAYDVEKAISDGILDCLALKNILPFEVTALSADVVDVAFRHLDSSSSITTLRVAPRNSPAKDSFVNTSRELIGSPDLWSLGSDSSLGIMRNPTAILQRQIQANSFGDRQRKYRPRPLGSHTDAHKLYCAFLEHENFDLFLKNRFRLDSSITWIPTAADIFDRLDLLAKDVSELGKYYYTSAEVIPRHDTVLLTVTISFGEHTSIGVRFTYDLSLPSTFLRIVPSYIYLSSIVGEPAVPLSMLQKLVEKKMIHESANSNSFLLKRLCTYLVDTIQGR